MQQLHGLADQVKRTAWPQRRPWPCPWLPPGNRTPRSPPSDWPGGRPPPIAAARRCARWGPAPAESAGEGRQHPANVGPVFVPQDAQHQRGIASGKVSFIAASMIWAPPTLCAPSRRSLCPEGRVSNCSRPGQWTRDKPARSCPRSPDLRGQRPHGVERNRRIHSLMRAQQRQLDGVQGRTVHVRGRDGGERRLCWRAASAITWSASGASVPSGQECPA